VLKRFSVNPRLLRDASLRARLITYTVILLTLLMLVTTYLGIRRERRNIIAQMHTDSRVWREKQAGHGASNTFRSWMRAAS
jgi:hypothetical protein